MMKSLILKKHTKKNNESSDRIKAYPKIIKRVGIFFSEKHQPDANFITKLKSCFGSHVQFVNFAILKDDLQGDVICLNKKSFNFIGKFKDSKISELLFHLDIVIDMSLKSSVIKDYALSLAINSYLISLGHFHDRFYNLSIVLDESQQNLFADEIKKYHNILSHAER